MRERLWAILLSFFEGRFFGEKGGPLLFEGGSVVWVGQGVGFQ